MLRRKLTTITVLVSTAGVVTSPTRADKVYWTVFEPPEIRRANLNGSDIELLLDDSDGLSQPISMDLHVAGDKMYFTNAGDAKIRRADLNGAGVEDVVTGLGLLSGIALDVVNETVYWCDFGNDKLNGGKDGAKDNIYGGSGADRFDQHYKFYGWFVSAENVIKDFKSYQGDTIV